MVTINSSHGASPDPGPDRRDQVDRLLREISMRALPIDSSEAQQLIMLADNGATEPINGVMDVVTEIGYQRAFALIAAMADEMRSKAAYETLREIVQNGSPNDDGDDTPLTRRDSRVAAMEALAGLSHWGHESTLIIIAQSPHENSEDRIAIMRAACEVRPTTFQRLVSHLSIHHDGNSFQGLHDLAEVAAALPDSTLQSSIATLVASLTAFLRSPTFPHGLEMAGSWLAILQQVGREHAAPFQYVIEKSINHPEFAYRCEGIFLLCATLSHHPVLEQVLQKAPALRSWMVVPEQSVARALRSILQEILCRNDPAENAALILNSVKLLGDRVTPQHRDGIMRAARAALRDGRSRTVQSDSGPAQLAQAALHLDAEGSFAQEIATSPDLQVRRWAAELIRSDAARSHLGSLLPLVADRNREVRLAAAAALGRLIEHDAGVGIGQVHQLALAETAFGLLRAQRAVPVLSWLPIIGRRFITPDPELMQAGLELLAGTGARLYKIGVDSSTPIVDAIGRIGAQKGWVALATLIRSWKLDGVPIVAAVQEALVQRLPDSWIALSQIGVTPIQKNKAIQFLSGAISPFALEWAGPSAITGRNLMETAGGVFRQAPLLEEEFVTAVGAVTANSRPSFEMACELTYLPVHPISRQLEMLIYAIEKDTSQRARSATWRADQKMWCVALNRLVERGGSINERNMLQHALRGAWYAQCGEDLKASVELALVRLGTRQANQ